MIVYNFIPELIFSKNHPINYVKNMCSLHLKELKSLMNTKVLQFLNSMNFTYNDYNSILYFHPDVHFILQCPFNCCMLLPHNNLRFLYQTLDDIVI